MHARHTHADIAPVLPFLHRYLHGREGSNPSDQDDVLQIAVLRYLERREAFEKRSQLATFLIGIARNVILEHARKARRGLRVHERLAADLEPMIDTSLESDFMLREDGVRLRAAMARLNVRDRWILEARIIDERPYGELVDEFRARFGAGIQTAEGLRTLFFNAKLRLVALMTAS